jgi:tRNA threonylcarbamoyladenosine biosynthesis protein TsaE
MNRTPLATLDIVSHSVAQTHRLGVRLGTMVQAGDVVLLRGDLGSGKTTFTQGIAQGLGVTGPVTSPTFILMREYAGRLPLYHMDLYRLERPSEALDLGFDSYMSEEGVCVVEWPEHATGLPADHLEVRLGFVSDTKRSLRFFPHNAHFEQLLASFRREAFGV